MIIQAGEFEIIYCELGMASTELPALLTGSTQPGYASLADPLYGFTTKRVKKLLFA